MEKITDYREFLSRPIAELFLNEIVYSVSNSPNDFYLIYKLIQDSETKISWRAAWACQKVFDQYPDFLKGKQEELIGIVMKNKHSGTRRILLSILLELPAPKTLPIDFLDFCFNNMLNQNQAIATQALCVKMTYKLCLLEPELLLELKLYLENAGLEYYSPGVKSCVRNVIKKLN